MFARRGFSRTSLRVIAQRAQVSIALIGHHFGNKQALYISVCGWVAQTLSEHAATELRSDMSLPEAGTHLVAGLRRALEMNPDLATCAGRELRYGGQIPDHPGLVAALHGEISRVLVTRANGQVNDLEEANWWASHVLYVALGPLVLEPLVTQSNATRERHPGNEACASDLLGTWRQRSGPFTDLRVRQG